MKRQGRDRAGMAGQRTDDLAVRQVDEVNLGIGAAHCELLAVRGEGQGQYAVWRSRRCLFRGRGLGGNIEKLLPFRYIPKTDRAVIAAGCQLFAVRSERESE